MKKISILFLAVVLLSCDDRFNFLADLNHAPVITFNSTSNNTTTSGSFPKGTATNNGNNNIIILSDSVKTSLKHGKVNYAYTINLSDPDNNIKSISLGLVSGTASLQLNNGDIPAVIPANIGAMLITVGSFQDQTEQIEVDAVVTDEFKSTATIKLNLAAFKNLPPIASFLAAVNNVNGDPYQYIFDASKSVDTDSRFGGAIQAYKWTVNGVDFPPISSPLMNQVFPGPGGYQVKLVVIDNDGVASPAVTQNITVK